MFSANPDRALSSPKLIPRCLRHVGAQGHPILLCPLNDELRTFCPQPACTSGGHRWNGHTCAPPWFGVLRNRLGLDRAKPLLLRFASLRCRAFPLSRVGQANVRATGFSGFIWCGAFRVRDAWTEWKRPISCFRISSNRLSTDNNDNNNNNMMMMMMMMRMMRMMMIFYTITLAFLDVHVQSLVAAMSSPFTIRASSRRVVYEEITPGSITFDHPLTGGYY